MSRQKKRRAKTGAEGVRWNLSDLYSGLDDPKIERDLKRSLARAKAFEERYRGGINSPKVTAEFLLQATRELESIQETLGKLMSYAHLVFAADTGDPRHGAFLQSIQEKITGIRNRFIFFELEIVAMPAKRAKALLKDEALSGYRHFIETERRYKPHVLTEPEEKIMEEKSNTGSRAFSRLFDEVINSIEFKVRDRGETKRMTEPEVLALLYDPERSVRRAAAKGLTRGLDEQSRVLTFIFNTLVQDHAITDRLRSYATPMDSRNLSNEIDSRTVRVLMDSTEKNFDMVRTYYTLKRKLLGYRKFYDYDRYAPIFKDTKAFGYKTAGEIVLSSFGEFSPRMSGVAAGFFDKSWIDAELRPGKRGGAFSHSTVPSVHPYVFINYTGRMRDVMTLAHELGHGVHQHLSRGRGYFQCHTPLTTAETASVFAEMLVFHKLKEMETNPRQRLALLSGKLEDIFATVFRQVVLTRFEESLHRARKEDGELTRERISELWIEANKPMFGDSVELSRDYALWWMYIPHFIHSPFYCYAYAFGELLVMALYNKFLREGKPFVSRYMGLLSAGGSDAPEALLKGVGVDISDPGFWQTGLDLLRGMVDEAVELAHSL